MRYNEVMVDFALPGEYTVQQVCMMLRNNDPLLKLWLTSDDPDAHYWLMVVYIPNGVYSTDLFRGCVLTLDLVRLFANVLQNMINVEVGASEIEESECTFKVDFCDFEWVLNIIVSNYMNVVISQGTRF